MNKDKLVIFDTTMRDGEQSPGASMTLEEKVRIGKALERMRVDVIEAGFAIASQGDFLAVKAVAEAVKDSRICSLARARAEDIDRAAEALKNANAARIHTFIATSPIHMKYKLRLEPDAVLENAVRAVKYARNLVEDVEFSCEDAGRSELDFLCRIIEAAIDAGASTINIPDTVGYAIPQQFGELVYNIITRVPNAHKAIFSVHCHNDLGLAVSNSLAAVLNGARQVECTINGLGERAGNAALEEVVMAIRTRSDLFGVETGIYTPEIVPTSRLVSGITGFPVQPNKAIVGANAFAHESGIHQDGVLKHRETYEIMRAEDVGWNANRMVLGKHSGRAAFRARLDQLGIAAGSDNSLNTLFMRFKELADKKHDIFDEDIHALVSDTQTEVDEVYKLVTLEVTSKTGTKPEAKLTLTVHGQDKNVTATGSGPVDASFRAIEAVANSGTSLELYSVNAITSGTDSQGEVTVRLNQAGRIINGHGADTDIVVASVKAYLDALNLINAKSDRAHPQEETI
ncbi:2-isopropylmalate synthase [Moraxellaceae bacterium AER2_44_116]|nr:2-isopropylmalate synthase [Moraxellaceae bacterium]TQC95741.1 2-isopropylmalate synthase [Moraxellaceae bacterium AER2_44_116]